MTTMKPAGYDDRVRELSRLSKKQLARIWWQTHPTVIYVAAPPEKWNIDELTNDILRTEFPAGETK